RRSVRSILPVRDSQLRLRQLQVKLQPLPQPPLHRGKVVRSLVISASKGSCATSLQGLEGGVPKVRIPSQLVQGITLLAAIVGTGSLALNLKGAAAKSGVGDKAMVTNKEANGGGRLVTIEAKPGPIGIDLARTAIVVVDMQNDFGAKGGMFDR